MKHQNAMASVTLPARRPTMSRRPLGTHRKVYSPGVVHARDKGCPCSLHRKACSYIQSAIVRRILRTSFGPIIPHERVSAGENRSDAGVIKHGMACLEIRSWHAQKWF